MKNKVFWIAALSVLLLTQLPYIFAALPGRSGVFGGFLLNPIDGNSYLAKMYEGWEGAWKFTLPYTAEPGNGGFLFIFYLFLGHAARWTHLSLLLVFHLARGLATLFMVWMLHNFWGIVFPDPRLHTMAFVLSTFGSGLGWMFFPLTGHLTPDFWVAEAYPFLSAYANPHFPLAIGGMLWILTLGIQGQIRTKWLSVLLTAFLLGLLLPFTVVITGVVLLCLAIWTWRDKTEPMDFFPPILVGLGGGIPLLYEEWIVSVDPVLTRWNAQNVTPAPTAIDFAVGFLPALIAAGFAVKAVWKKPDRGTKLLASWLVSSLLLVYLPLSLQRRFMVGWMIPISGIAALGLRQVEISRPVEGRLLKIGVITASVLTPLVVLLGGVSAAAGKNPSVFLIPGERPALTWIKQQTSPGVVILASPATGLLIPAYTGRRVIYGHPYETIQADQEKQWVESVYKGSINPGIILREAQQKRVSYLYYGPREAEIGPLPDLAGMRLVYDQAGIRIFALGG